LGNISGRFENRARLHLGDLRVSNAEPATAMAEHRIEFVQLRDPLRNLLGADADFLRQICLRFWFVRKEFVQRWIKKTNRRRITFEGLEDADEIGPLIRE